MALLGGSRFHSFLYRRNTAPVWTIIYMNTETATSAGTIAPPSADLIGGLHGIGMSQSGGSACCYQGFWGGASPCLTLVLC